MVCYWPWLWEGASRCPCRRAPARMFVSRVDSTVGMPVTRMWAFVPTDSFLSLDCLPFCFSGP